MLDLSSGLQTSFSYIKHDADGKSSSFDLYNGEMTYFTNLNRHSFVYTASFTHKSYKGYHPIFDNKREDDIFKFIFAYEYRDIPNWDNWSFTSINIIEQNDSNIDFYKENEFIFLVGLNYKF